ncbi:MAG: thiamine pyrophosphate-dependent enzyme, partial [Promethearchaeota archaeon]
NVALRIYFLEMKEDHIHNRMNRALEISEKSELNRIENENSRNEFELGIITSGVSYNYVVEALDFLELEAPIFKIGIINPLPVRKIVSFIQNFKKVLIVEENDPYLETQILAISHRDNLKVKIYGKDPFSYSKEAVLLPYVGELNPTKVVLVLMKITKINPKMNLKQILEKKYKSITRNPILCAGCPHRTTGYALQKAIKKIRSDTGKEVYFYQDIGCYTLLVLPPYSFANVKYCMGSSIALAQGVAHTSESLNIAIIGDGTFFHSGIPALLNAFHHNATILVIILDNGWIGMTGQQPHPGSNTSHYLGGEDKNKIKLESFLLGTGANIDVIKHDIRVEQEYSKNLIDSIYKKGLEVLESKSLRVIVIQDECIQKAIKREAPLIRYVEENLCSNCGICFNQLLCPAISQREEKAYIMSEICLGCGICEEICPSKAIHKEEV